MSRTIKQFEKIKTIKQSSGEVGYYYNLWWYGDSEPTEMTKTTFEETNPNLEGKDITKD